MNSGGSFGANPLEQHIGIGSAATIQKLEVYWPKTGKTDVVVDVESNQRIVVTEGKSQTPP